MPEIYGLIDPRTGAIRYIGKANCSKARFKSHLRDARRRDTPVYRWIKRLGALGLVPKMVVLEVCDDWESAERRLIAEARSRGPLLNVANGGNEPACSFETRVKNGRKSAESRVSTPLKARVYALNRNVGQILKAGRVSDSARAKLRYAAHKAPHLFGQWATV